MPGRLPDDAGAQLTEWALVGRTGRRDADWRDGAPDHAHRLGLRETPSFGSESGGCGQFLAQRPCLGEQRRIQSRIRRRPYTTSLLGRNTSLPGSSQPSRTAGQRTGRSILLSQGGILRRPISPKAGRCAETAGFSASRGRFSPKPRRSGTIPRTTSLLGRNARARTPTSRAPDGRGRR